MFGRRGIAKNMPADKEKGVWGLSERSLLVTGIFMVGCSIYAIFVILRGA